MIESLLAALPLPDARSVAVALEGLSNVLAIGSEEPFIQNGENPFANKLEELGGLDIIEELQYHNNMLVYKKALKILEKFFKEEKDKLMEILDSTEPTPGGPAQGF